MSSGGASGRDAFDFLSNISFGAPESGSRSTKKSKPSQSRVVASSKSGEMSRVAKGGAVELVEMKIKNFKSNSPSIEDSPGKSSLHASHKPVEHAPTPVKLRASHSGKQSHKEVKESKPENGSKSSQSAAFDFLSGVSLGSPTPSSDYSERSSKDFPVPSIPIPSSHGSQSLISDIPALKAAISTLAASSSHPDTFHDDSMRISGPEEEIGVHEATTLLFPHSTASEEHPPFHSNTEIFSGKEFLGVSKEVVHAMLCGRRTVFSLPSASTTHSHHIPHPHSHGHRTLGHNEAGTGHVKPKLYGALIISSILCSTDSKPTSIPTSSAPSNAVTSRLLDHWSERLVVDSDTSDDDFDPLTRHKLKPGVRILPFKKKAASTSYQRYLKPTVRNAEMNREVALSLPILKPHHSHLIASGFQQNDAGDSGLDTPSPMVTPRNQKNRNQFSSTHVMEDESSPRSHSTTTNAITNTSTNTSSNTSSNTSHTRHSDQTSASPSKLRGLGNASFSSLLLGLDEGQHLHTQQQKGKEDKIGGLDSNEGVESSGIGMELMGSSGLTSLVGVGGVGGVGGGTTNNFPVLPLNAHSSVFESLVPYERCLKSYDPSFLDHDIEPEKYLIKVRLPGYTSSILPVKPIKLVRQEENEAFKNRHTWLKTDLTLSKVRSVKRKLEQVAISLTLDIACTAFSFVYFEKLVLRNLVSNHNARVYGAVCLLLAAKWYGVKMPSFSSLIKELCNKLKLSSKELLSQEFFIYRKLKFSLFVEETQVMPHFFKLRASPNYLDKEFQVQQKERKKHLRKQQLPHNNPSSSLQPPPPPPPGAK